MTDRKRTKDQLIAELKELREQAAHSNRMKQVLFENMRCVALSLKSHTREIVASNEAAKATGAVPGKKWKMLCAKAKSGTECFLS